MHLQRKSNSVRVASSALHSTSSTRLRACATERPTASSTAFGPIFSLCFMCTGLVEMKVWMRGRAALRTASAQRSMSAGVERERPQITALFDWAATALTAAKSPSEAAGKPASMMSTPMSSSRFASSSFSLCVIDAPGDCSPSRMVVSKMNTRGFFADFAAWSWEVMVLRRSAGCREEKGSFSNVPWPRDRPQTRASVPGQGPVSRLRRGRTLRMATLITGLSGAVNR